MKKTILSTICFLFLTVLSPFVVSSQVKFDKIPEDSYFYIQNIQLAGGVNPRSGFWDQPGTNKIIKPKDKIVLSTIDRNIDQLFQFKPAGDGWYNIVSKNNGYIEVAGGSEGVNIPIQVNTPDGAQSQKFRLEHLKDGRYKIFTFSGKCIALGGFTSGSPIVTSSATNRNTQEWQFIIENTSTNYLPAYSGEEKTNSALSSKIKYSMKPELIGGDGNITGVISNGYLTAAGDFYLIYYDKDNFKSKLAMKKVKKAINSTKYINYRGILVLDNNNTLWDLWDDSFMKTGLLSATPVRVADNVKDFSQRNYLLMDGTLFDRIENKTIATNIAALAVDVRDFSTAALDRDGNLWIRPNQGKTEKKFKKIDVDVETLYQNGYHKKDKSFYTWGSFQQAPILVAKNVDKVFNGFTSFMNVKVYADAPMVQGFVCDGRSTYIYSQNNSGKIADFRITSANQLNTTYFTFVKERTAEFYTQLGQNCGVAEWKIKKASMPFSEHTKMGYKGTDGAYYLYDSTKYQIQKTNLIAPRIKSDGSFFIVTSDGEKVKMTDCITMDYIYIRRTMKNSVGSLAERAYAVTRTDGSVWIGPALDNLADLRPMAKVVEGLTAEQVQQIK
jgi:hypothetical protein